ncbi:hypothetical protein BO86DRAFT_412251 [Aspergillus japonicus CBS 114.51]|uniref:SRR1-like domain-containing protein n=1 Tax=Aspergillus japonicus CBS 114.51 TaxID=1448312 RepID=A0A8T8WTC0_ASPJA|nr:hypothetical protein BO86DRAFT_412251 [Aspergillus japonicus CBS 114.51]RAH78579.1 hypothetical protein BO86DRAFT_412251 [Aspergillus japonicus CBS 114.51]
MPLPLPGEDNQAQFMFTVARLTPGSSQPRRLENDEQEMFKCMQLYKLGVPLYTREAILNAYGQLKASKRGDIIKITAIDGTSVDFIINTGRVWIGADGYERELGKPRLCFMPIQRLESCVVPDQLHTIPCSIRVAHRVATRDPITKERFEYGVTAFEKVRLNLFTTLHFWRNSPYYQLLRYLLDDYPKMPRITKIIGFDCGSMSRDLQGQLSNNSRARYQHAFLIALKEYLDARNFETTGQEVRVYVQHEMYLERDIEVIRQFGVQVLQDPEGFLVVDEETVIFSCRPECPVRQVVADLAMPAMMIWDHERDPAKVNGMSVQRIFDPWSTRLDTMMRFYHVQEFVNDEINFGKMDVCIRRPMADVYHDLNDPDPGSEANIAQPVA